MRTLATAQLPGRARVNYYDESLYSDPVPGTCRRRLSPAFRQREEIVVPLSVGVGAQIFAVRPIHDADVAAIVADESVEGVGLGLDRIDDLLARPVPGRSAEVGDPLIGNVARLLVDARHLHVCHELFLSKSA